MLRLKGRALVDDRRPPPRRISYPLDEAVASLGISRQMAYRLMNRNVLRTFKIGRCRYVRHTEIEACIDRLGKVSV